MGLFDNVIGVNPTVKYQDTEKKETKYFRDDEELKKYLDKKEEEKKPKPFAERICPF